MRKSIDARGLACPQPVIMVRRALSEGGLDEVEVVVDNEPARENVLRFLEFCGAAHPAVASRGAVHAISATVTPPMIERARAGGSDAAPSPAPTPADARYSDKTLFLSADRIGRGDDDLGRLLVRGLLYALAELPRPPRTLVLMNSGVRLAAERDDTIELLAKLEARGVEVLACGTCLDYFHLVGKLRAGRVSNMYEIAERFLDPGQVVTIS